MNKKTMLLVTLSYLSTCTILSDELIQTINEPWLCKDEHITRSVYSPEIYSSDDQIMPDEWYHHLYQIMKDVHELFTLHKIEYWIQGGTLLGAIRHKGIMKWDDDLDINIQLDDRELFESIIPLFEELNYEVSPVWFGYKIAHPQVFTFGKTRGAPCLDLFFTIERNNKIYYDQHWMIRDNQPIYITKKELYPLKTYTLGELTILGPNNPVPYLNASYERDWPYYAKIWNHFFNVHEERELTENDLIPAPQYGALHNRVFNKATKPVRVYASMVADLFHYGHVEFLKQAHALGTHLVVGIISDEVATNYKRQPILTQEERIKVLRGCKYVDEVVPNAPLAVTKDFIDKYNIDIVVHGDDFNEKKLKNYFADPVAMKIMRLIPYTEGISTSDIINRLKKASQ
ncbi:MAG TPA: adenylyltransferase/cytidyltransferase family protein [Candidatus Babeliales bacterium]|nr:adenylyltransferase/cytidyltransferase family protein [Candidatus Babeliales bacterium]